MGRSKASNNSLIYSCLVVTVVLHLAFVTYLFRNPLFFEPSFSTAWTKGMLPKEQTKYKSLFLQEALSELTLIPEELKQSSDLQESSPFKQASAAFLPTSLTCQVLPLPSLAQATTPFTTSSTITFPKEAPLTLPTLLDIFNPTPTLPSSTLDTTHLLLSPLHHEALPLENTQDQPPHQAHTEVASLKCPLCSSDHLIYLTTHYEERENSIFSKQKDKASAHSLLSSTPPSLLQDANPLSAEPLPLGNIEAYMLDVAELNFSDWSDYFHLDVAFLPREEDQKYRFALTLSPIDDMSSIQMRQCFHFLIDRSNSIEKHRYNGFKKAVLRALSMLSENETFNICIFDRKSATFSEKALPVTKKNIVLAKQFLDQEDYSGTFSAGELYKTLSNLIPEHPISNEMQVAILLTDGTSSLTNKKQNKALNTFLNKNHRQLSLYAAACGQGNNLSLLKVLASQTGGDVLYSPTHAAFSRKLAKFVRSLKEPLAKEISVTLISKDKNRHVKLLSPSPHLAALYNQVPYTLYGTMDQPGSITIALEGLHKNQPIVIQKELTFDYALSKSPELEKAWLEQLSLNQWSKYLKTGDKEDLKRATHFETQASEVKLRRVRN